MMRKTSKISVSKILYKKKRVFGTCMLHVINIDFSNEKYLFFSLFALVTMVII